MSKPLERMAQSLTGPEQVSNAVKRTRNSIDDKSLPKHHYSLTLQQPKKRRSNNNKEQDQFSDNSRTSNFHNPTKNYRNFGGITDFFNYMRWLNISEEDLSKIHSGCITILKDTSCEIHNKVTTERDLVDALNNLKKDGLPPSSYIIDAVIKCLFRLGNIEMATDLYSVVMEKKEFIDKQKYIKVTMDMAFYTLIEGLINDGDYAAALQLHQKAKDSNIDCYVLTMKVMSTYIRKIDDFCDTKQVREAIKLFDAVSLSFCGYTQNNAMKRIKKAINNEMLFYLHTEDLDGAHDFINMVKVNGLLTKENCDVLVDIYCDLGDITCLLKFVKQLYDEAIYDKDDINRIKTRYSDILKESVKQELTEIYSHHNESKYESKLRSEHDYDTEASPAKLMKSCSNWPSARRDRGSPVHSETRWRPPESPEHSSDHSSSRSSSPRRWGNY